MFAAVRLDLCVLCVCVCQPSPINTNESSVHNAAKKEGLVFQCKLDYLDLPICTGHDDDGNPIVEIQQWPFLLPSDLVL